MSRHPLDGRLWCEQAARSLGWDCWEYWSCLLRTYMRKRAAGSESSRQKPMHNSQDGDGFPRFNLVELLSCKAKCACWLGDGGAKGFLAREHPSRLRFIRSETSKTRSAGLDLPHRRTAGDFTGMGWATRAGWLSTHQDE